MAQKIKNFLTDGKKVSTLLFILVLVCTAVFMSDLTALATQVTGYGYGYAYGDTSTYGYGYGYWTENSPTLEITYSPSVVNEGNNVVITATFSSAPSGTPDINIDMASSTDLAYTAMSGSGTTWTYTYTATSVTADETATVNIRTQGGLGNTPTPGHNTFTVYNSTTTTTSTGGGGPGITSTPVSADFTINENGGTIQKNNVDGGYIKIIVPANAVPSATTFTLAATTAAGQGITEPTAEAGWFLVNNQMYSVVAKRDGVNQTLFDKNLTVSVQYMNAQLNSITEDGLSLFYWDTGKAKWVQLDTTVDKANNIATVTTPHLTVFALMGNKTSVPVDGSQEIVYTDSSYRPVRPVVGDLVKEKEALSYFMTLTKSMPEGDSWSVVHFIAYGTPESSNMSVRDRKGVIGDYYEIYGRVPTSNADWRDIALILTSHKPVQRDVNKEKAALYDFVKVYKRLPNYSVVQDEWAMYYIGYKIRNVIRSIDNEKAAIGTFKSVYKYVPSSSHHWAIMRAIAYSGAKR